MKIFILIFISLFPASTVALSLVSPCNKVWPKNVQSGKIILKYRISETCEPTKITFVVSEPNGVFNELAMCEIKRIYPFWPSREPMVTISEKENKRLNDEYREALPEKYHSKRIHFKDVSGERMTLSCFSNKERNITGYEVENGKNEIVVDSDYIKSLPEQSFESLFESEH